MRRRAFVLAALTLAFAASNARAQRQRFAMDPGWRFTLGDPAGAQQPRFDDRTWRRLDLPHDWSIESTPRRDAPGGGRVGFFETGTGWYRKAFSMPAGTRGQRAWLEFDGCHMNCDVWINGVHLGRRPNGYVSYMYDVTSHLVAGVNVVAVRVDNSRQPNSRWYTGSGIYRHVWLTVTDPLHVGHWGTFVTTPRVDEARADVEARTRVENDHATPRRGTLRSTIHDAGGREVARTETPFTLAAGQRLELVQRLEVPRPALWSVATPHRYTLRSTVQDGERTADTTITSFGIRTFVFAADSGFALNGRRLKLNGVNLHHDGGAVGAAVPERVWVRRLERLREMGANAIRTAHNPPAPEFLDLADSMGFVVMAEAFDEWTLGKVDSGYHLYYADWSERDVVDFVRRDRNHPSIVLWSAGNEIGEQDTPAGVPVLQRLIDIFHREDPTRPVTTGNDHIAADNGRATIPFLDALDVVGYNYVDRWHERRELFAEADRRDHPAWRMIGTESVAARDATGNQYSLGDDSAVVRPNYATGMVRAERLWRWVALHDYFAGDFMWTGIDYLGESSWPRKGFGSGPIDMTGEPRDSYYFYQSQWTTQPVLRLFPHWNWPAWRGQLIPVLAYTNCNRVELFLNGRSLGEQHMEFPAQGTSGGWNSYALPVVNATTGDLHFTWHVPYEPGVLRAVGGGRRRDGTVACNAEVRTAGPAAALRLTADRDTITAAPGDVVHTTVEIVDSAGTVVPTAGDMVRFTVTGGTIVALDNADLTDHAPYRAEQRRAFNGRLVAIVRAGQAGPLTVTATADGLPPRTIRVHVRPGVVIPVIPAAR